MDILDQLKIFGYAVQPNAIDAATCAKYADELDKIEHYKVSNGLIKDIKHQVVVYNLHGEKPDLFLHLVDGDPVFGVVQKVLSNGQQIILNSLSASRSIKVNEKMDYGDAWRAHIDTRMPAPDFGHTESIVAAICLDDFTVENGATRVWPYSHLTGMRPPLNVDTDSLPGAVQLVAKRGTVFYWLGQTWHAISKNFSGQRRWGIIYHYTYWWIKPTFDYTQCGPELYHRLSTRQKGLLGFNSRPPSSPDIRVYTVTKADELPDDYEAAMRPDYSTDHKAATAYSSSDTKG
jgi:ectoine hydroxylase-related dioxygenase (phytanoyl-CoA dioxygenase family)